VTCYGYALISKIGKLWSRGFIKVFALNHFNYFTVIKVLTTQTAFDWHHNITFLAANAGISSDMTAPHGILDPDFEELTKPELPVLDINLFGTIYCIKTFLHFMHKKVNVNYGGNKIKGRIVVTSSEAGLYALSLDPVYCASKHAVRILLSPIVSTFSNNSIVGRTCPLPRSHIPLYLWYYSGRSLYSHSQNTFL
jgi:NAD(P)-dependent dehydrogenase (short-subunit alcohol dehydrogenase family)